MVFALLTAIAIETVIPEPDPSLVILGLVGSAKQVAEGVNATEGEQYSLQQYVSILCKPFTW